MLTLLCFSNCNEDEYNVIEVIRTPTEAEIVYPNNPETGIAYTADELIALAHDPLLENFYTKSQPVALEIKTNSKPSSVSLIIGEDANRKEITDILEDGANYIIRLNTTVEELEIEQGSVKGIAFEINYASANSRGLVQEVVTYKVNRLLDPREFNSFIFFEGLVQTFAAPGEFATLDQAGKDLSFRYTKDFSVSIWVNTTATNSDPSMIGDKDWGSGSKKGFVFAYTGADWKLNLGDGSNRVDISGKVINDGEWHLLTVTFDRDGDAILYEDLVEKNRENMSDIGDTNSAFPINVAQDGTGTYGSEYLGQTREVYIHDVALTLDELKKLFPELAN